MRDLGAGRWVVSVGVGGLGEAVDALGVFFGCLFEEGCVVAAGAVEGEVAGGGGLGCGGEGAGGGRVA